MEALGFVEGIELAQIANVTTEQFGIIISKIAGFENGDLSTAEQLGFIDYYDDGTINPEDYVKYRTVITSIIKLLGYDQEAQLLNIGYSQIYGIASGLGITKDIKVKPDETVSGILLAKLMYRILDIPLMEQVAYGQSYRFEISKYKTLLTERHNIYKDEGQIRANEFTGIYGFEKVGKGQVIIGDGLHADVGNTDAKYLLGYYVDYYYKMEDETKNKTLLWVYVDESINNEVFLKSTEIESYDNFKYTYNENEREVYAHIQKDSAVIYNGIAVDALYLSDEQFRPQHGI